mmetsp:Transcript_14454/g.16710  ORF Transcript_14454/g.16710 Transcript_14454/m.16710 type:complete len:119 (-) Transcript_14454:234-590(-)
MMKGRIKAEQSKITRRLKKLLIHTQQSNNPRKYKSNEDVRGIMNTASSQTKVDTFSEFFNKRSSSEESSVDSKQRKLKALDRETSFEFDSYYQKHMAIPGTFMKKKTIRRQNSPRKQK